ncbi:MAG: glycosyltransferase family 4 protein [Planctomycetota bacterium]|nr:glycosyltransferase family 4 protein [Planctomycetota bacterium]
MKILHISDYFDLEVPGGSTSLIEAHLIELARRGHEPALLAGHPGEPPPELSAGIPRFAFRYPANGSSGLLRSVAQLRSQWRQRLDQAAPNLVVFHQPLSANALLDLVDSAGIPIIYMFHSPWPREHMIGRRGRIAHLGASLRQSLEGRALRRAFRVTTESRYMQDEARRLYGLGLGRMAIIPGGVDLDRFRPSANRVELRKRLGVPPGLLIFTLRRLVPRMGVERLVEAVASLSDKPRPVQLWIGGTGPEETKLRNLAEKRGKGRVRFLGHVPEADAPNLYAAADLCVVPSIDLEGFGLATLESLACGTPVLATPVGANPEILRDLDVDLLLTSTDSDAIAKGIDAGRNGRWDDPTLRERCRSHAAARYAWGSAVSLFEALASDVTRLFAAP